jgi:mRNA-degrading endonuclease RelE of RelBE toxin-antitoxin system
MNWILLLTKPARKELARIPDREQARIVRALQAVETDPFSGDIKRLDPPGRRRRAGEYRIFYDLYIDEHRIVVTSIQRRTSTTYR